MCEAQRSMLLVPHSTPQRRKRKRRKREGERKDKKMLARIQN